MNPAQDYWLRKTTRARRQFWWHVYLGPEKLVSLPTRLRAMNYIARHQVRHLKSRTRQLQEGPVVDRLPFSL